MDQQPEGARDLHRLGQDRHELRLALGHEMVDDADAGARQHGILLGDDAGALEMGAQALRDLVEIARALGAWNIRSSYIADDAMLEEIFRPGARGGIVARVVL